MILAGVPGARRCILSDDEKATLVRLWDQGEKSLVRLSAVYGGSVKLMQNILDAAGRNWRQQPYRPRHGRPRRIR